MFLQVLKNHQEVINGYIPKKRSVAGKAIYIKFSKVHTAYLNTVNNRHMSYRFTYKYTRRHISCYK